MLKLTVPHTDNLPYWQFDKSGSAILIWDINFVNFSMELNISIYIFNLYNFTKIIYYIQIYVFSKLANIINMNFSISNHISKISVN